MKIKSLTPWLLTLLAFFSACGNDDPLNPDAGSENNVANDEINIPASLVGKVITWSESNSDGTAGNYDCRVEFINQTDIETNFSDWTTYTYTKLSNTKAHLNFMAPQSGGGTVRTFQYDFDLNFISSKSFKVEGTLKVNYLSGPNVGQTVLKSFTGKGWFTESLWGPRTPEPDEDSDSGTSDTDNLPSNFTISKPEVTNITETSAKITGIVSGKGSYSSGIYWEVSSQDLENLETDNVFSQTLYCDEDIVSASIDIVPGYTYNAKIFVEQDNKRYFGETTTFTALGSKNTEFIFEQTYWHVYEAKLTCRAPAYVVGNYGICWSETPNPKISDNYKGEVPKGLHSSEDNLWELGELKRSTKYYVRPYHIENGKVTYYNESTFQTLGLDTKLSLDIEWGYYSPNKEDSRFIGKLIDVGMNLKWEGYPNKTLKARVSWYNGADGPYGSFDETVYIDGPKGEKRLSTDVIALYSGISYFKSAGRTFLVQITDFEGNLISESHFKLAMSKNGIVYYNNLDWGHYWFADSRDADTAINGAKINE